jgi:hypothetical protein
MNEKLQQVVNAMKENGEVKTIICNREAFNLMWFPEYSTWVMVDDLEFIIDDDHIKKCNDVPWFEDINMLWMKYDSFRKVKSVTIEYNPIII